MERNSGLRAFRYEVNLDHPLVHQAMERMGTYDQNSVKDLLSMCALAFPVERAVLRINGDQKMQSASEREDSRKLVDLKLIDIGMHCVLFIGIRRHL